MKNYIILLALLVVACGGNSDESSDQEKLKNGDPNAQQVDSSKVEKTEDSDIEENDSDEEEMDLSDCAVDFDAYIMDPSESATNVRKTPGGEVITEISPAVDHAVHIIGVKGKWFKIDFIEPFDTDAEGNPLAYDIPGQFGWIHQSVLELGTRNYGNQTLNFYEKPDQKSAISFTIDQEFYGMPVNACGDYVKLQGEYEGKKVSGWVKKEWLCSNPLTTCS